MPRPSCPAASPAGIANLHNHTINGPLFRGIVDDLPRRAIGESKVYSVLMPMGSLAMTWLTEEQRRDLVALGLLEVLRSGATTMVDQFRPPQRVILELARDWGPQALRRAVSVLAGEDDQRSDGGARDARQLRGRIRSRRLRGDVARELPTTAHAAACA